MSQKQHVTAYYNTVAEDYDTQFYQKPDPYPTLRYRHNYFLELIDAESFPPGAKALDIGCGPGELSFDLARRSFETIGMDISAQMIDICRAKQARLAPAAPVTFTIGDIEHLPYPDASFDCITAAGVVEYLTGDEGWAVELHRVLKPGGILVLNVTNTLAIRRLTSPILDPLKRSRLLFRVLNTLKRDILKKGELVRFPFQPRTHIPWKFDRFLETHGFTKCSQRYFAFSILPYPLDTVLSFVTLPIRKRLERFSSRNMALFGTGYIVKARKK